jgi:DNA-3-methyladenine glycosylase I
MSRAVTVRDRRARSPTAIRDPSIRRHHRGFVPESSLTRCAWVPLQDPAYVAYHDEEWGVPSHDDRHLFELLTLEGAQAGLSWSTILHKRDGYRRAFANFDAAAVARFSERDVERLLGDAGIVRNRLKVESAVNNAQRLLELRADVGSLDAYVWSFVGGEPIVGSWRSLREIPAETAESRALSKDLKKRGFRFVGPTVCYAFMQAVGLVDDHTLDCFRA